MSILGTGNNSRKKNLILTIFHLFFFKINLSVPHSPFPIPRSLFPKKMLKTQPTSTSSQKLPLRFVLIVPFVLQIFAAVALVGWLSFRNGREAVNQVASQLRTELAARVEEKVLTFLDAAHRINQINVDAIRQGYLDLDSPHRDKCHFKTAFLVSGSTI